MTEDRAPVRETQAVGVRVHVRPRDPPVIDARPVEARKAEDAGHWTSVAGYGEVFTTTELFDVTAARDHFDGTVEAGECRFCAFDARNREHHARNAGKLF